MPTTKAEQRADEARNFWKKKARPVLVGQERFRVTVYRFDKPKLYLDPYIEQLSWTDEADKLEGQVQFRQPEHRLDIGEGHVVRCEVARKDGGGYRDLWYMKVVEASWAASGDTMSLRCQPGWDALQIGKDDWRFVTDKKHPNGWLVEDIIRYVAKRTGVKLGRIPKTGYRIKKLVMKNKPGWDVIVAALKRWKDKEGVKVKLEMRYGKLEIREPRRPDYMFIFRGLITDAAVMKSLRQGYATHLTARATIGKGADKKKAVVKVHHKDAAKRYGRIHVSKTFEAKTEDELRRKAKRWLAASRKVKKSVSFNHPGIPSVRKGDALRIVLREQGIAQIAYVSGVTHTVTASSYDMAVNLRFDDIYKKDEDDEDKKCEVARKRGRKLPEGCEGRKRKPRPKRERDKQRDEDSSAKTGGASAP